ncbi:MAG TPA: amidase family protein [Stellaceae bacterium]|nr:amidase family protein [Stellaceae bacterium]
MCRSSWALTSAARCGARRASAVSSRTSRASTLATRTRFGITARWRALFRDIDAIFCPAMPTPAFPHDHAPIDKRLLDVDGTAARYADQVVWATIATLNGLPATTLPIARSPEGLPIGAQLIGAFLEDRTTIALAGMVERELGCAFTPPPGY